MLSSHTHFSEKQCYSKLFYFEMCVPCHKFIGCWCHSDQSAVLCR